MAAGNRPLASICIPSYNHARFLSATIESALAQTYRPIEVVIVDDGSRDGSLDIARDYAARYSDTVRVLTHSGHTNRGISATVNLGVEESRGEYWSGLPSDDQLYPDKVARQVEYLEAHPERDWVYSYADFMDDDGKRSAGRFGADITGSPDPMERLLEANCIPGMAVLARRECVTSVGPHDESLVYSDWDWWLRMLSGHRAGFIPRSLVKYRVHGSNTSIGPAAEVLLRYAYDAILRVREKAGAVGGLLALPRYLARMDLQLAHFHHWAGLEPEARAGLADAFTADPSLLDADYLASWLRRREIELLPFSGVPPGSPDFGMWLVANLPVDAPPGTAGRLARKLQAVRAGRRMLASHLQRDYAGVRQAGFASLLSDPGWLRSAQFRSLLAQGLAGPRIVRQIRRLREGHGTR